LADTYQRVAETPSYTAGNRLHDESLTRAVEQAATAARDYLLSVQKDDGHWCFELEADCTIPAEYIMMMHYMDEVDPELERKLAAYIRQRQGEHGGWPLYYGGAANLSCSVKAYYALKLVGDPEDAGHMRRARELILAQGGAARANVFTRIALALFGQIPWRGVPFIPVEIMLLPRWFPFHLTKVSYWTRTVLVPLLILCTLKPQARNPKGVRIRELFVTPPEQEKHYFPVRSRTNLLFNWGDAIARRLEPLIPRRMRQRALREAESWFMARLNGTDGLGAIFPAMVNAYEAMDCLGYPPDHPDRLQAREALDRLLVIGADCGYCQPCVSPVWDTALASLALQEAGDTESQKASRRGLDWLQPLQLRDEPGDWQDGAPSHVRGGGWPFQYRNDYYPDVDDTAVVAWAMDQDGADHYREAVDAAAEWVVGMQSSDGGFAAFDVDNTHYVLNEIPFADHGALLDPPTADVSARSITLLGRLARKDERYRAPLQRALAYLRDQQEPDGAWFGRWGTNYIYGTWSALVALEAASVDSGDPGVRRGAQWLRSVQQADGGWGESNDTYHDPELRGRGVRSNAFQTAWAILGLLAAGEVSSAAVGRGIDFLLRTQRGDGAWEDDVFTAPGFPRVFYLKYHGYNKFFPLWALARYRNLLAGTH
jgi:squalene-hopene/tetraprenyl-beta-curcumene cyclase